MRGLFQKFKEGLKKSTPNVSKAFDKLGSLFGGRSVDTSTLESIEQALYEADFGVETTSEIVDEIRAAAKKDKELRGKDAAEIGARVLENILEGAEGKLDTSTHHPTVICLLGVNGSGKTTTAAKLGWRLQQEGDSVLLGACDTFRAAANEQIANWSERLDLPLISSQHGADAAAVAYDAYEAALHREKDTLILDTAGRLHTKENLMNELGKLKRVLKKRDEQAPHHSWLVVDASIGSNSIEQARKFHESFGLDGIVLTKLDGTSRGGALVGIYRELGLPIYYVGLGEKAEDLQPFEVSHYARALFGLDMEPETT